MLLTHRKLLQSKAIAIDNDLRGTLRNFGLKVGVVGASKFEARIRELVENLPDLAELVEPLLIVRRTLREQIGILHGRLLPVRAVRPRPQMSASLIGRFGSSAFRLSTSTVSMSHDRDTKFTRSFRSIIASGRVEPLALPARSPNLNAYAERWVRSVKEECLSQVILFGERSLRRALRDYVDYFHAERNHQGRGNVLLFPRATAQQREGPVRCRERLGGLLRYYHREAA